MAEKGLSLRVILELIDKMSGPLQKAAINVEGLSKGLKASIATAKALAPVIAASVGAHEAGEKLNEAVEGLSESAEPLAEAKTLYEQLAGSQNLAAATAQALKLTRDYGVASWDQELTALARAQQLYGNYSDAVKAADAANRLALGTHSNVSDTLEKLAITSRNAGVSTDVMANKLAVLYKAGGPGAAGAASDAQLQKAYGLARSQGVKLDRFLAIVAEAERVGLRTRDVEAYFTPSKVTPTKVTKTGIVHPGHVTPGGGARAQAVRDLINRNAADITRLQDLLGNSADASGKLAEAAADDAAHQVERANLVSTALKQAAGAPALNAVSKLDQLTAAIEGMAASAIIAHPKLAQIGADLGTFGGKLLGSGGTVGGWATTALLISRAFSAWKGRGAGAAGEAAAGAGEAAGGAAEAEVGAGLLGILGAAGLPALIAGGAIAAIQKYLPDPIKGGIATMGGGISGKIGTTTLATMGAVPIQQPTKTTNVAVSPGPVTITVNVPAGTSPEQAREIADAMKAALELHDPELARKLAEAVSDEAKKTARTEFGGDW